MKDINILALFRIGVESLILHIFDVSHTKEINQLFKEFLASLSLNFGLKCQKIINTYRNFYYIDKYLHDDWLIYKK